MRKLLLCYVLLTYFVQNSNAQFTQYPLPSVNPDPTLQESIGYLKSLTQHVNSNNPDGYERAVERFEHYWETRINKDGKITDYTKILKNFSLSSNFNNNSTKYSSGWKCLGPFKSQSHNIGRATAVWVKPNNTNYILIGTRASGIWKTINGGQDWENITDRTLPTIGIQSIAVSPINDSIIYATTGFSGSYTNNYGIGIIYSNDAGMTWHIDNPPNGYSDLVRTDLLFLSPLAFNAGSNQLYVGLDQKVWRKNVTKSGGTWDVNPVYVLDNTIQDMDQYIHEIDFAPNSNFGIITPTFRKPEEMVYTSNGGLTWNTMPLPARFTNLTYTKAYTMGASIVNDNFAYIIICGNDFTRDANLNWIPGPRIGSVLKYDITNSIPVLIKEWNIINVNKVENELNGFSAITIDGTRDICFFGKRQNVVYKADLLNNIANIEFVPISNYLGNSGNQQTHTDIRGMTLVSEKLYAASDGGISMLSNLLGGADDWLSLNGYGLAITEHSGFDISEIDKDLIVGAAIDGNSFKLMNSGTGEIVEEMIGNQDQYDVALPKSKEYYDKNITTDGPTPNQPPLYYGPGIFGGLESAYSGTDSDRPNVDFALKQFYFEDITNDFYAGTSDVFKINNFLGKFSAKSKSDWTPLTNTNKNSPVKHASLTTLIGISAFKSMRINSNIFSVYAIKKFSTSAEPITLVKSSFNTNNPGSVDAYTTVDITPYQVKDHNGNISNNSMVYQSYITEVIIDENNPDKIWICFGGTSLTSPTPSGRVYFTDDGGVHWSDISTGLPELPVLSMVYWKGTDDVIFAGTDLGVYVFNKTENKWEGFNNNLPYVCVTKLAINYCTNTLRACTFGRGFWESPLPMYDYTNTRPKIINTNETWNASRDTYQDVLVKTGATLTIQGTRNADNSNSVEIRIPKDKRIIVEAGAKLIIDGATLTNHCDMWQGIEVYGQKNEDQDDINQGRLILKNGAIIENARKGISTAKSKTNGFESLSTGGIIECENSLFINNLVDIEVLPYHRIASKPSEEKINKSYISRCTFETNNKYLFAEENPIHIYLWEVNGVKIVGSYFVDNRDNASGSIGIKSINAGFYVNEYCSGISLPVASAFTCAGIRNVFEKLAYGIQAYGLSNPKYSVNISNTSFNSCSRSVYLNGINNASIFLSNFNITRNSASPLTSINAKRYGIYLDMCKSYKVENNSLMGDVDIESGNPENLSGSNSFGMVLRNMHGENVEVKSNVFNKLSVGIEAIGRNRGQSFDKGLQIRCNNFENTQYDIVVVNDPEVPVASNVCGIAKSQGYPIPNEPNRLAGNLFANASPYLIKNFVNNGAVVEYYHHSTNSNSRVSPIRINNKAKIILRDQQISYSNTSSCPSSFTSALTASQLRTFVITQQENLEENRSALAAMIDGGDTEQFLLSLDLSDANTMYTNYFLLMNVAPYLSREVIFKVLEDGLPFTNAMIRNVLVACPQSAKDDEVQRRLDERSNALPKYMREQINTGLIEVSDLEIEEREIGTYLSGISSSINENMWRATQDTLNHTNYVIEIFNESDDYIHKLQLVEWLEADQRESEAENLIHEIENHLQAEEEIQSVSIYRDLRNFKNEYLVGNVEAKKAIKEHSNFLINYLQFADVNVSQAMALLALTNDLEYREPLIIPSADLNRITKPKITQTELKLDPSESSLELSPNPATEWFVAKYKILEKSSNLMMIISDNSGKELLKQELKHPIDEIIVNCSSYPSGTYVVSIKGRGLKAMSQKIIITRN